MINLNEPMQPTQEEWGFVKELAAPFIWHFNWTRTKATPVEADLSDGVTIENNYPDIDKLETAFNDLDNFFKSAGIKLFGGYKIIFEKSESICFESYQIDIQANSCRIEANDSEGIRRAVYYLEDLLLGNNGPFLRMGLIKRKPWLKSRISRCFFGPIKRPPLNRDELLDEIDYYPEEYLNRLAHEGINGLWLTIAFRDLCKTSITQLDCNAEKRLIKLRKTVDKCLRFGIRTYIFCIEPRAMSEEDPIIANNPELKGAKGHNSDYCFCPFSATAQKYLFDSTKWIFQQVPNLGGMINISHGERTTSCASVSFGATCPVCSKKTPGEILAAALKPMEQGMHSVAPKAELISWLYVPENGTGMSQITPQLCEIAEKLPENIVLQYNFESGGSKKQLGKKRHAGDYWLSYVGPSRKYHDIMQVARKHNKPISAKIQVGCSHEVATVPFVPVPGLLYRKYKEMHKLGVSHVMQCWYFGNYPGIMNKAAGELAFEHFEDTEEKFLKDLAQVYWGKHAEKAVEAWKLFAEGYSNYPLDNMFQYYGPMHDGVVWPLYLNPVDKPLAPTWKLEFGTSADRYGECLGKFSLEDVLMLCSKLSNQWHKGTEILLKLKDDFETTSYCHKDIVLAEALDIHFRSGKNILCFYAMRDKLITISGEDGVDILNKMRMLLLAEIQNSSRMIELCNAYSSLGFHPEAEGYKYYPEKLAWRVKLLERVLHDDFPEVINRLINNKKAFKMKPLKKYVCNCGRYENAGTFSWKADYHDGGIRISINNFDLMQGDYYKIYIELKPFHPPECYMVENSNEICIPIKTDAEYIGFNIYRANRLDRNSECFGWENFKPAQNRLILGNYNPHAKGSLIIRSNKRIKEIKPQSEKVFSV